MKRAPHAMATIWTWVVIAAMVAGGAIVHLLWAMPPGSLDVPVSLPWWVVATGFGATAALVAHVTIRRETHTISLVEVPLILGLAFASPAGLIAGRLIGAGAVLAVHRRQRPQKLAFNLGLAYLETATAVAVYRAVLGGGSPQSGVGWLAALAAVATVGVIGFAMVMTVITINEGERPVGILRRAMSTLFFALAAALVGLVGIWALWRDARAAVVIVCCGVALFVALRSFVRLQRRSDALALLATSASATDEKTTLIADSLMRGRQALGAELAELWVRIDAETEEGERFSLSVDGSLDREIVDSDSLTVVVHAAEANARGRLPHSDTGGALGGYVVLSDRGFRDGVIAPVYADGRLLGALAFGNKLGPRARFTSDDLDTLRVVAGQAGRVALMRSG